MALLIVLAVSLYAQSSPQPAARPIRGRSFGSYSISDIENINLTNGNLSLTIPLASLPPIAGGKLSWTINAVYNSKLWDLKSIEEDADANHQQNYFTQRIERSSEGGWRIGGIYQLYEQLSDEDVQATQCVGSAQCNLFSYRYKRFVVTPDGARHELRPLGTPNYPQNVESWRVGYFNVSPSLGTSSLNYYSYDGSYLWATVNPDGNAIRWQLYMPDGTRIVQYSDGIQRIFDTDGNKIKIVTEDDLTTSIKTTHYVDEQTNREIKLIFNPTTGNREVMYQTVSGVWVTIKVNYGNTTVQGLRYNIDDRICTDVAYEVPSLSVVREIVLPQTETGIDRKFTFKYNSDPEFIDTSGVSFQYRTSCTSPLITATSASHGWGALSKMVLPSGAEVEYDYSLDGPNSYNPNTAPDNTPLESGKARVVPRERVMQKRVKHDSLTDVWQYPYTGSTKVINPDGSKFDEYAFPFDPAEAGYMGGSQGKGGLVYRTERFGSGTTKVVMERQWVRKVFDGSYSGSPNGLVVFNPVVAAEYTTLFENNQALKMSAKTYQYDFNGNVTEVKEYDWFDPALIPGRDAEGVPTGLPTGLVPKRVTTTSYYNPAPNATDTTVYAKREFTQSGIPPVTPFILNAPQESVTGPSQMRYSYDGQGYGAVPIKGNVTQVSNKLDPGNLWLNTLHQYDSYGNRTQTTDPRDNITKFEFGDSTHANLTKITRGPCPGDPTSCQQVTTMTYDLSTGALLSQTDPNGATTTTSYTNNLLNAPDPFLRPGLVTGPPVTSYYGGTSNNQQRKVRTTYYDNDRRVKTEASQNQSDDINAVPAASINSETRFDQLGRAVRRGAYQATEASKWTITDTQFDALGRVSQTSNPYTAADLEGPVNPSGVWTQNKYDLLSRVIEVKTPDTTKVVTEYYANQVMVTDQDNKKRLSETDGLGRLTKVWEIKGTTPDPDNKTISLMFPPSGATYYGYLTQYTYDDRNNLTRVRQGNFSLPNLAQPVQFRAFYYDSLSRLLYANNPEQEATIAGPNGTGTFWTMKYEYDNNGNLTKRTDARNVMTTYTYDALNRNTAVDYSNTNSLIDIERFYDTATQGKGRLASTVARVPDPRGGTNVLESHTIVNDYDLAGRVLSQTQRFKNNSGDCGGNNPCYNYTATQQYNLAGSLTQLNYPFAGRKVENVYAVGGRLDKVSGNLGNLQRDYAYDMAYNAAGQMVRERFTTAAPQLYHTSSYNDRFQMTETRLGSQLDAWDKGKLALQYGSSMTTNNGNVVKQEHFVPVTVATDGTYTVTSWVIPQSDEYQYDALNRLQKVTGKQRDANGAITQIYTQGYTYDQFGNRKLDMAQTSGEGINNKVYKVNSLTNRLIGFTYDTAGNVLRDLGSPVTDTRQYDAENRMTMARVGNAVNYYVYDGDGRRVRRIVNGLETWQVYGIGGELLAEYPANAAANMPQKEYGYRAGQLLVTVEPNAVPPNGAIKWLVGDHLGTPRIVVSNTGGVTRHDYLPFGEELEPGMGVMSSVRQPGLGYAPELPTAVRQKFTGKERDGETGLDYFIARYYSNVQGRFVSPDAPFADQISENPQSWNLFTYVRNTPLNATDPRGRETCYYKGQTVLACEGANNYRIDYENDRIYVKDKKGRERSYALDARFIVRGYQGADTLPFLLPTNRQFATGVGAFALAGLGGGTVGGGAAFVFGGSSVTTLGTLGQVGQVLKGPIANAVPINLAQQLSMAEAVAGAGTMIMTKLGDAPRLIATYGPGQWVKMQHVHRALDGTNIVIHWFRNLVTGQNVEYKFK